MQEEEESKSCSEEGVDFAVFFILSFLSFFQVSLDDLNLSILSV